MTRKININSVARLIGLLVLAICLGLTFFIQHMSTLHFQEKAQFEMETLADESHEALLHRINSYEQALLGGVGFFAGSDYVSRGKWKSYIDALDVRENFRGINGIGWISDIKEEKILEFLEKIRSEGAPDFKIHPEGDYPDHFVITYIEPMDINHEAVGLNIGFEAHRREAANLSRDSGKSAITKRILLVQDAEKTPGFLLLLPMYKAGMPVNTVEQRRAAFDGWIYAPFIGKNFMKNLTSAQGNLIRLRVYDGMEIGEDSLIYDSHPGEIFIPLNSVKKTLDVKQQRWVVIWEGTPTFQAKMDSNEPLIILAVGLIFTLFISIILFVVINRSVVIEQEVRRKTQEIKISENKISVIMETLVDGLITINTRGTIQSFTASAERIFGFTSAEVTGKNVNILMPEPYASSHDSYQLCCSVKTAPLRVRRVIFGRVLLGFVMGAFLRGRSPQILTISQAITSLYLLAEIFL